MRASLKQRKRKHQFCRRSCRSSICHSSEVHQKPQHSLLYQRRNQLFAEVSSHPTESCWLMLMGNKIEPLFPKGWMSSSQLSRQSKWAQLWKVRI